ncbi:MAG: CDP-alcohol phosphatidyltransferase family protein [Chloroflexota bacterium]
MANESQFAALLAATVKSSDTEEKIDLLIFRRVGLAIALLARKIGATPNVITVLGILSGIAASRFFYYDDVTLNVAGILLLALGSSLDSADGQLARMTNNCSRIGRTLDGISGYLWFIGIYLHLYFRFLPEGNILAYTGLYALAIVSHSFQSAMADYYRNAHLYFVFGKNKSEFDSYETLAEQYQANKSGMNFIEKFFALLYINYTRKQEALTKNFQRFIRLAAEKFGQGLPQNIRSEFRGMSRPLQKYCNGLTLNARFFAIYLTLFFKNIYIFLLFETVVLNIVLIYLISKHEAGSAELNQKMIEAQGR